MNPSSELTGRFDAMAQGLPRSHPGWLADLRRECMQGFVSSGFEGSAGRHWPLASCLAGRTLKPGETGTLDAAIPGAYQLTSAHSLVFVDGLYAPHLSRVKTLPDGVIADPLSRVLETDPESLRMPMEHLLDRNNHPLSDWVAAWFYDGVYVYVPPRVQLECPIQIVHIHAGNSTMVSHRHIIRLAPGAEARVLETHVSLQTATGFSGTTREILLAENAGLHHYTLQCGVGDASHYGSVHVGSERDARFHQHHLALGGGRSLAETGVELGQNSSCELDGFFHAHGKRHVEINTLIEHVAPHGSSREHYRGMANDQARGVFNGKVVVYPHAQKTVAEMQNRNLLLSGEAEIDSTPQLEIHADDVRCSHGVTVGQLDAEAIFFLTSRGLSETEARTMLSFAFAYEVIGKIDQAEQRQQALNALLATLPQTDIRQDWL